MSHKSRQPHPTPQPKGPLASRLPEIITEAWWLVLVVLTIYLVLILVTYHPTDPGWSHNGGMGSVQNSGGKLGAWLADVLLSLFGLSAYLWTTFSLYAIWWGYKGMDAESACQRRSLLLAGAGFLLLLTGCSGLESLRFYSHHASLPLVAGGMVGDSLARVFSTALGFTGATLALLLLIAVGLSLFTGISWLDIVENFGAFLERSYYLLTNGVQAWQDRKLGREASVQREERLAEVKKHLDEHLPIQIEQPVVEIPKSERVVKEKQVPLFADMPDSELPPLHLLDEAEGGIETLSAETLEYTSRLIERKLLDFGVEVKVTAAMPGPVITRYEIEPATGVKGSQIVNLARDLARSLSVASVRVVETIPGKSCMGLEIPNPKRQTVRLSEILAAQVYADMASPLTIAMGKDIGGKPVVADLAKMPHVLVAGTTGSGKSVAINAMILSLLYKALPAEVRLILVDPKMLELSVYEGIPHLLAPVVTDMKHAANALNWCVAEMEKRYKLMSALGVRNLAGFNQKVRDAAKSGDKLTNPFTLTPDDPEPLEEMPLIVVIIDELADLMMVAGKKVEELIARLAQKARASGIHLVLATQRPSVDVITGLIKANIPTRIAFQVSSKIDSRTILDQMGAEALLGQGDMLYLPPGTGYPQRVHGAYVADAEVHRVVEFLKAKGQPQYVEGILEGAVEGGAGEGGEGTPDGESDPMYDEAVAIVLRSRRASISAVQRQLRIGYNRAARLIEQMEQAGLVSPMQPNGNREVLVPGGND